MTIEIKQLVIRAVVDARNERRPVEAGRERTAGEPTRRVEGAHDDGEREALISAVLSEVSREVAREVRRELKRGRER